MFLENSSLYKYHILHNNPKAISTLLSKKLSVTIFYFHFHLILTQYNSLFSTYGGANLGFVTDIHLNEPEGDILIFMTGQVVIYISCLTDMFLV